jgi:quercetin dioxygenase-like cupin family protein
MAIDFPPFANDNVEMIVIATAPVFYQACRKIRDPNTILNHPANMNTNEVPKSEAHITVEIVEYVPNSVVTKTILRKSTGNISVMSFDSGEGLTEKTTPFDTFLQIIEGNTEIVIDGEPHLLATGQSIVIPAHAPNSIKPHGRFKMILTVIKSGYE